MKNNCKKICICKYLVLFLHHQTKTKTMTPQTTTDLKIFILSSPERIYPINYLDGLPEEHLKLIANNIEDERKLNAKKLRA